MMNSTFEKGAWIPHAFIVPIVVLGLYLISLSNYLLFHALVEIVGIAIATTIFVVACNTNQIEKNPYLLLLGIGFFFVACVDLLHTMAYKGMGVFHGFGTDLPTQLWVIGRYVQALTMLIAPLAITRKIKPYPVFMAYAAVVGLLLVSVFKWRIFPVCFVEGEGLTSFKVVSEYTICLILLAAILIHLVKRQSFDPSVLKLIIASMLLIIASELAFTLYIDTDGYLNRIGHFLKIISYYLLYIAILEIGLKKPYALLFSTLADSEEKYRTTFESITDSITVTRIEDGRYLYVNQGYTRITGYESHEVLGRTPADINLYAIPGDRERFIGILKKYGQAVDVEIGFRKKNGEIIYTEFSAKPIDYDGKKCLLAQAKDITARKKAQEDLRQSDELHKAMIANISDVIAIISTDAIVKYKSPNIERWFGWRPEDLAGKEAWVTVHPDDLERTKQVYYDLFAQDSAVATVEYRYRCKDGSFRPIQLTAVNLTNDPIVNGFLVNYHDISDQKAVEEALERRIVALTLPLEDADRIAFEDLFNLDEIQQLQDDFASAAGIASMITRIDGTPITRPSNFCRFCQDIVRNTEKGRMLCSRSDAAIGRFNPDGPILQKCSSGGLWDAGAAITIGGKHIANWLVGQVRHEEQSEAAILEFAREIGADEQEMLEAYLEVPVMPPEEFERIAQALFTLSRQLSTTAYQNIQQARFISERKKAADEKALIEDQLRQAQKMEAIGTLAGGIAHDFNNILSAIIGYCELAVNDIKDVGKCDPDHLEEILKAGTRAKDLVTQILTFSRKVDAQLKPIDLNKVIEQTGKMLERTIPKMVTVEYHSADNLWAVNANPSQISQVLMNLCTNANDAMPDGGRLTIETENVTLDEEYIAQHAEALPGNYVLLSVSDTGHGMGKQTLEKIFDPFFTQKEVGKGTGLGLATVYGIVKAHKGYIICYSEIDRGTTFKVYLPALNTPHELEPIVEKSELVSTCGTELILLVDDDIAIRDLGLKLLSRAGYQVLLAETGEAALEIYREMGSDIDLVILDISMPGMGGHKCLLELVKMAPKIKVIISSGYSRNGQISETLDAGAAGFVPKPFTRKEMLKKVREVLDH